VEPPYETHNNTIIRDCSGDMSTVFADVSTSMYGAVKGASWTNTKSPHSMASDREKKDWKI
jgi:hypothetical protein